MTQPESTAPYLSVVIPAFNESEGIADTIDRLLSAIDGIPGEKEVIVVDDGSSDDTAAIVERLIADDPRIRLISLSRNFGHQNAVSAGLNAARGDNVAVIDADLQDPPELIPNMLAILEEGSDVVYGVRENRKEPIVKRAAYKLYYHVLALLSERPMPHNAGDFSIMKRRVVEELDRLTERRRYIRGLRNWVGFKQTAYPYDRNPRQHGSSKYKWKTLFKLATSGVVSSTRVPLTLSIYVGIMLAVAGFLWAVKVTIVRLLYDTAPEGFSALMVAILVIGGAQLVAIGMIGMYLSRVLDQVEGRPSYIIARRVDHSDSDNNDSSDVQN